MSDPTLPDYLCPQPRLLLVGLNPGAYSVKVGHYYGRLSNRFWRLLSECGLVPQPLTREDDARLPSFGIAITDLVKRSTANIDTLSREEFVAGAERIRSLVAALRPGVVGFNGLAGYRAAFDGRAKVGLQSSTIEGATVVALASTSPRVGASLTYAQQLAQWRELARVVDLEHARRRGLTGP